MFFICRHTPATIEEEPTSFDAEQTVADSTASADIMQTEEQQTTAETTEMGADEIGDSLTDHVRRTLGQTNEASKKVKQSE